MNLLFLLPRPSLSCLCNVGLGDTHDLYARFFGPWAGIAEDPVTGSAYTVVAPYFSEHVLGGKQQMAAKQVSSRGGVLQLDLATEAGRVVVSGKANVGGNLQIETAEL